MLSNYAKLFNELVHTTLTGAAMHRTHLLAIAVLTALAAPAVRAGTVARNRGAVVR